jgi:flavin reductase (DIM6/NTAB) family NADH-FMN oxidoreductase RutF
MEIIPGEVPTSKLHGYLVGAVAPRPIAFASTVDKDGNPNLSPFSFFNAFGAAPPILVFSPARRVRDNTTKHTLHNARDTKEVVINVVSYSMVQQASVASGEYPREINEFIKSGFTPIPSIKVKPFRVKESPVQMECKVLQVIETGQQGGAANLIICEIVYMHINDNILDEHGKIDPNKIDLVGRMGGNFYSRASGSAIFELEQPNTKLGIGVDSIPQSIRLSKILTGNNLGQLASILQLPSDEDVEKMKDSEEIKEMYERFKNDAESLEDHFHLLAKKLLDESRIADAWKVLLIESKITKP